VNELRECEALMRGGSKSFFAASRVLPARVRAPATALYAFCRVADDAIDLSADPARALDGLRTRLDAIYADAPHAHLADRAFACVVQRYAIPRALPDALLEGFAWDAEGRRYPTMEALHAYGARVAGTVGAMMALVMQTHDAPALARACELGVAMQLTNIARDVGEDARHGRLYLPLDALARAGVDVPRWLAEPHFDARIAAVVAQVLAEAERLYARAEPGVAALPRDCRPAIQAARLVYAEIGRVVEAAGYDSVSRRAVVSGRRKLALMLRATAAAHVAPGPGEAVAPSAAVRHLVEAAASEELPSRSFYERTVRMIDLFERLEHRRTPALYG
jgi:phytoene synthase